MDERQGGSGRFEAGHAPGGSASLKGPLESQGSRTCVCIPTLHSVQLSNGDCAPLEVCLGDLFWLVALAPIHREQHSCACLGGTLRVSERCMHCSSFRNQVQSGPVVQLVCTFFIYPAFTQK